MEKLSIGKYAGLCVLGGEVAYTSCVLYGLFLEGEAYAVHLSLFQLLPGYSSMNISSWFLGAVTIAVWSAVGGAFIAWMHNVSIVKK